jgi:ribosomal protein L11 methyltransferase
MARWAVRVDGPAELAGPALVEAGALEIGALDDRVGLFEAERPGGLVELVRIAMAGRGGSAPIRAEAARMLDWDSVWAEGVRPFKVGGVWVVQEGHPIPADGSVVRIGGEAFGTGMHPTTALCAERVGERPPTGAMLDIGCGSGILALIALAAGSDSAVAVDTDAAARAATLQNAKASGLEGRLRVTERVPNERFELVAGNLLLDPVLELIRDLPAMLGPGGEATFSGFRDDGIPRVEKAARWVGLAVVGWDVRDGWARVDIAAKW